MTAIHYNTLQHIALGCRIQDLEFEFWGFGLQGSTKLEIMRVTMMVAVCCSVLQCVSVCFIVLQCVVTAVWGLGQ